MGAFTHQRWMRRRPLGFTLVELVIVMTVVAILLSTVLKSTSGMMIEGNISKTESELQTLKAAITSYWKNNSQVYPADIHTSLVNASPQLLVVKLTDPFHTDQTNDTYGYLSGADSTFGSYFAVYTRGPRADTSPVWDTANQRFNFTGSGQCASNAPVIKF